MYAFFSHAIFRCCCCRCYCWCCSFSFACIRVWLRSDFSTIFHCALEQHIERILCIVCLLFSRISHSYGSVALWDSKIAGMLLSSHSILRSPSRSLCRFLFSFLFISVCIVVVIHAKASSVSYKLNCSWLCYLISIFCDVRIAHRAKSTGPHCIGSSETKITNPLKKVYICNWNGHYRCLFLLLIRSPCTWTFARSFIVFRLQIFTLAWHSITPFSS